MQEFRGHILNRKAGTNNEPKRAGSRAWRSPLLLIFLDDFRRTNLRVIRVLPDLAQRATLTQQIPTLIEFDFNLGEPRYFVSTLLAASFVTPITPPSSLSRS